MGMLSRYQKKGGFVQLLHLIETCGPQKQSKFLEMIDQEDHSWAEAIRDKMLSIEKIFTWDNNTVSEVAARLNELTIAVALHGLTDENWGKLSSTFSHSQKRRIEDLRDEKKPTAGEISASYLQIIDEVRNMISYGYIKIDKIDQKMVIEDNIEELLEEASHTNAQVINLDTTIEYQTPPEDVTNNENSSQLEHHHAEVKALKQQIFQIAQENQKLKSELSLALKKLGQIKKLSA